MWYSQFLLELFPQELALAELQAASRRQRAAGWRWGLAGGWSPALQWRDVDVDFARTLTGALSSLGFPDCVE
jgi:hypothetical protein